MANPSTARDLRRISDLGYELGPGEPDVRGWPVYAADAARGRAFGVVADLLVDPTAGEVVMLDVDLRDADARGDDASADERHTLAPLAAARIDAAGRRVVLDARGDAAGAVPALPRTGALSDDALRRFNDDYVRAYGERAGDRDATWRVRRGEAEVLHFAPPPAPARIVVGDAPAAPAATIPASAAAAPRAEPSGDADDRRVNRVDDASELDDSAAIDPRELDAMVRIQEGATVDEDAPVSGVRYEGEEHVPHAYGRPDEAYGPEYGSGRIGFDKIVTRHPFEPDASPTADTSAARTVRYRRDAGR